MASAPFRGVEVTRWIIVKTADTVAKTCHTDACTKSPVSHCSRCGLARYCSVECQRADWIAGHRSECDMLVLLQQDGRRWALCGPQRRAPPPDLGRTHVDFIPATRCVTRSGGYCDIDGKYHTRQRLVFNENSTLRQVLDREIPNPRAVVVDVSDHLFVHICMRLLAEHRGTAVTNCGAGFAFPLCAGRKVYGDMALISTRELEWQLAFLSFDPNHETPCVFTPSAASYALPHNAKMYTWLVRNARTGKLLGLTDNPECENTLFLGDAVEWCDELHARYRCVTGHTTADVRVGMLSIVPCTIDASMRDILIAIGNSKLVDE